MILVNLKRVPHNKVHAQSDLIDSKPYGSSYIINLSQLEYIDGALNYTTMASQ